MEEKKINVQLSEAWFEKKHGRWGSSTNKHLMSEGKVLPKTLGGDGELKYKWGDKAKTAIFSMFMQRLTKQIRTESYTSAAMERGLELEPLAIERFLELYMQYEGKESSEVVDTGFILFPDNDGTREWEPGYKGENSSAGASPDHLLYYQSKLTSGIETKARGEEAGYSHAYSDFDETHPDFWQVQTQMHTTGTKYWYYLNYDDQVSGVWDLSVTLVEYSPIHMKKLIRKQKDADALIADYLERCEGVQLVMPDVRSKILNGIWNEVRGLSEVW